MNKFSAFALASVLVAGLAAPAFASEAISPSSNFDADYIVSVLNSQGVKAEAAYEAGKDTVRVVIQGANGVDHFAYYDLDTLTPIQQGIAGTAKVNG